MPPLTEAAAASSPPPSPISNAAEDPYEEWRHAARFHLAQGTAPEVFEWRSSWDGGDFFGRALEPLATQAYPISVALAAPLHLSEKFEEGARLVALHRSAHRWKVLYRVAWRLIHGESRLLEDHLDADVHELEEMKRAVVVDRKRAPAAIRWHPVPLHHHAIHLLGAFEPHHHVARLVAADTVRRHSSETFSLVTPEISAHWDRSRLFFTRGCENPGVLQDAAALEAWWRAHGARCFEKAHAAPAALAA